MSLISIRRLHQVSETTETLFHSPRLPQVIRAIDLLWADKGEISALRLAKFPSLSCLAAHRMLRNLQAAIGDRNHGDKWTDFIELDDADVGRKCSGGKLRTRS